jgi:acyl-CoA dehydrogenase
MSTESYTDIREAVRKLCAGFPGAYWRDLDRDNAYPSEFVAALSEAGYLSVLIPEEYGGAGLPLSAACAILEEVQRAGCNGGACHAQMYTMGTLLRHGSAAQKEHYLPRIASGELRLQSFGVTEPGSGTDTTRIRTTAVREDEHYVVNGQKVWISRTEHSDLMVLLVRTTPRDACERRTDGMSVLIVDIADALAGGLEIRPIRTMMNHATTELFFSDVRVPAANLIGEEGKGFRYIMDGMNAERILIAAECIGDARYFTDRASRYACEREVFGRPIGQNQGIQFPIARAYVQTEAAAGMVDRAAALFDAGESCGSEANMAKLLASEASWQAGDTCVQTFGGYGFAEEYDIQLYHRRASAWLLQLGEPALEYARLADAEFGPARGAA